MSVDKKRKALVVGASGGIATAIIHHLLDQDYHVYAVSRSSTPSLKHDHLRWYSCDYTDTAITSVCEQLSEVISELNTIYLCNGILHGEEIRPEKQLAQLASDAFLQVLQVNTLLPMRWIQNLHRFLNRQQDITLVVFSARVGSIEDNGLGGWYSYRASKAALNMLLKTYSVELQRKHPKASILIFHPGTTDTELSKPFQKNVPDGKLFTADFVAYQLFELVQREDRNQPIDYLDWQGKTIPW